VLHDVKSRTFHPKLYVITGETASVVITGSGNLTKGGVSRNYEAGTYLELDLNDAADVTIHNSVTHYIERLQSDSISRPLTSQLIQQLPTHFHIRSETHPATTKSDDDSFGASGKPERAAQLFGASLEQMKSDPPSFPVTDSVT
jgi:hypothetical protein